MGIQIERYESCFDENISTDFTKTPEFKKWFGNSKVVDKSGKPLIVYHGTNSTFNIFNDKVIGSNTGNFGHFGYGFYFSFDIREAKTYGNNIVSCYLKIINPFYNTKRNLEKYAKEFGGYNKVNVAIDPKWLLEKLKSKDKISFELANNIVKYGYDKGWEEFLKKYVDKLDDAIFDVNTVSDWAQLTDAKEQIEIVDSVDDELTKFFGKPKYIKDYAFHSQPQLHYMLDMGNLSKEFTERLKKDGYDGVIIGSEIIAFYPNQIKSATDNNGNFSIKNNNIYESCLDEESLEEIQLNPIEPIKNIPKSLLHKKELEYKALKAKSKIPFMSFEDYLKDAEEQLNNKNCKK